MLLYFSVENFLSFKEKVSLNFTARPIKEKSENVFLPFPYDGDSILKSLAIYGKNSCGKSNLIKAFSFMRSFVVASSKESQATEEIKVYPFRLSTETESRSSLFEVVFQIERIKYRYGFKATKKVVESEWLFQTEKKKESKLFIRSGQEYNYDKNFKYYLKGKVDIFTEFTRPNSLLISVLAQFNIQLGVSITKWFDDILVAHDMEHLALIDFSARLMSDAYYNHKLNEIISKSDLGIDSIEQKVKELATQKGYSSEFLRSVFKHELKDYSIKTYHTKYGEGNKAVEKIYFDLIAQESLGTQKYFGLIGPILLALTEKKILFIDEVDARLHPLLLESIISMFNSEKYNPNGAQLIFTSHNTLPLKKLLRRDQMFFVDKDNFGVSKVESIFNRTPNVRNDASFDKDYLDGKYGAIPKINTQLNLFDHIFKEEKE